MLIIGHRGAAGLAPENTRSSFIKAIEANVDMIETDLRLLNGQIVLSHDKPKAGSQHMTLVELLTMANRPLNLEIKEVGFEEQLLKQIHGFAHKVLITSYNLLTLKKIRALDTNIQLGPVVGRYYGFFLPLVTRQLKKLNVSAITIDVSLIDESSMSEYQSLGWQVYAFTNDDPKIFNDPEFYRHLKNLGVAGIFTDYPNIVSKFKDI